MRAFCLAVLCVLLAVPLGAESFAEAAQRLLDAGDVAQARQLATDRLQLEPRDVDALSVLGTCALYSSLVARPDETIYHPVFDAAEPRSLVVTAEGVREAERSWKDIPAIDPQRTAVWEDLSTLFLDAGQFAQALSYARRAAALVDATPTTLKRTAYLAGLAQDWSGMIELLQRIPGSREVLLYRGLEAWKTGAANWRVLLKSFIDAKGPSITGSQMAAWMLSDKMRDTDAGYQELLRVEPGFPNLLIKQRYADRYPDQFAVRLDLARNLCQYGNYDRALELYADLERRQTAKTPDEKVALAFHSAWAYTAAGRYPEATNAWKLISTAKDFYVRSAAAWFLGRAALEAGRKDEARTWWSTVADEPPRSKYATWAYQELAKLK